MPFSDGDAFRKELEGLQGVETAEQVEEVEETIEEPVEEEETLDPDTPEEEQQEPDAEEADAPEDDVIVDDAGDLFIQTAKGPMIPKGRFDQINNAKKQAEAEAARAKAEYDKLVAALNEFAETSKEPEKDNWETQVENEMNPGLSKKVKELEAELAKIKGQSEKVTQATEQQEQLVQFNNAVRSQADTFIKEAKVTSEDLAGAYDALYSIEFKKAKAMGIPEQQAQQAASMMMQNLAAFAMQNEKNVAETFWNTAKELGYTPKAKKGTNFGALKDNMKKTNSAASVPAGKSPNYGEGLAAIDKIRKAPGKMVDPAKFKEMMDRYNK